MKTFLYVIAGIIVALSLVQAIFVGVTSVTPAELVMARDYAVYGSLTGVCLFGFAWFFPFSKKG